MDKEEFCYKYDIPSDILDNYLDSCTVGDIPSKDTYKLIIDDCCPFKMLKEMRIELDKIVKEHHKYYNNNLFSGDS